MLGRWNACALGFEGMTSKTFYGQSCCGVASEQEARNSRDGGLGKLLMSHIYVPEVGSTFFPSNFIQRHEKKGLQNCDG